MKCACQEDEAKNLIHIFVPDRPFATATLKFCDRCLRSVFATLFLIKVSDFADIAWEEQAID